MQLFPSDIIGQIKTFNPKNRKRRKREKEIDVWKSAVIDLNPPPRGKRNSGTANKRRTSCASDGSEPARERARALLFVVRCSSRAHVRCAFARPSLVRRPSIVAGPTDWGIVAVRRDEQPVLGAAMAVLVARRRDNVVSISAAESLKMLAYSVIWGSWVVIKNAAAMVVGPLRISRYGIGIGGGRHASGAAAKKGAPTASGGRADKRLQQLFAGNRGYRPPPCLSSSVYGVHSYVKIKVKPPVSKHTAFLGHNCSTFFEHPITSRVEAGTRPQRSGKRSKRVFDRLGPTKLRGLIGKKDYKPQHLKTKYGGGIWLPRSGDRWRYLPYSW